jgi:hypothetical protein
MIELPEVTWTPAECEGLPPVGSAIAIPAAMAHHWTEDREGWVSCTLGQYLAANDPVRPPSIHGDVPIVYVGRKGFFVGFNVLLEHCVLLGIEKQPKGWPNISDNKRPDLDDVRSELKMSRSDFAELLIHWLKDNGYYKWRW